VTDPTEIGISCLPDEGHISNLRNFSDHETRRIKVSDMFVSLRAEICWGFPRVSSVTGLMTKRAIFIQTQRADIPGQPTRRSNPLARPRWTNSLCLSIERAHSLLHREEEKSVADLGYDTSSPMKTKAAVCLSTCLSLLLCVSSRTRSCNTGIGARCCQMLLLPPV
jgi:hypothetical protein